MQPLRRKVVRYNVDPGGADAYAPLGAHGTHVAGSAVGSCLGGEFDINGVAPDSRIAFYDIGNNSLSYLIVTNLTETLWAAYSVGAKVHSNSWGTSSKGSYTSQAQEMDAFMYHHPDMLIIVAAGNDGDQGMGTIGSPATAKNVLTVGAASVRQDAGNDTELSEVTLAWFSSMGNKLSIITITIIK